MPNYREVCWYCKGKNMKPVETWWQCKDCGVIYEPSPALGPAVIESGNVFTQGDTDKPTGRAKHPTAGVKKQARLAREAKGFLYLPGLELEDSGARTRDALFEGSTRLARRERYAPQDTWPALQLTGRAGRG